MRLSDGIRYALFAGIAATADANRRQYHLATTWLPHLAMNGVALLLPDVLRPLLARVRINDTNEPIELIAATLQTLVCDNPTYVAYALPLAAGYLLSHPEFNIYKGKWGEMQLAGFGFDAIPHTAAGFTLSAAVIDTLRVAASQTKPKTPFATTLDQVAQHPAVAALAVLVCVTVGWEWSEYRVHRYELAKRGSIAQINMQWSVEDTITDCLANLIGWTAAAFWRKPR